MPGSFVMHWLARRKEIYVDFDPFKTKEDVEEFSRMVEEEKARNTLKSRPSNDPAQVKPETKTTEDEGKTPAGSQTPGETGKKKKLHFPLHYYLPPEPGEGFVRELRRLRAEAREARLTKIEKKLAREATEREALLQRALELQGPQDPTQVKAETKNTENNPTEGKYQSPPQYQKALELGMSFMKELDQQREGDRRDAARKKAAKEEEAEVRAFRVEEAKAKLERAEEELR
jgi:hypothetical protein